MALVRLSVVVKFCFNRFVDDLEKGGFFLIASIVLGLLGTADLLTVVSDIIVRAFNRSGATRAVAHDIF